PGARAGDDAESLPGSGKLYDLAAVLAREQRVEMQPHRELDRLARGARGSDDDDASGGGFRSRESFAVGRKIVVANVSHVRKATSVGASRRSDHVAATAISPRADEGVARCSDGSRAAADRDAHASPHPRAAAPHADGPAPLAAAALRGRHPLATAGCW